MQDDDYSTIYKRGPTDPDLNGRPLKHPGTNSPEILVIKNKLTVIRSSRPPILIQTRYHGEKKHQPNYLTGNFDLMAMKAIELELNFELQQEDQVQLYVTMADPAMKAGTAPKVCRDWNHGQHKKHPRFLSILPYRQQYSSRLRMMRGIQTEIIKILQTSAKVQFQLECTSEQSLPLHNGSLWMHVRLRREGQVMTHVVIPFTSHPSLRNDCHQRFGSKGWIPADSFDGTPLRRQPTPMQKAMKLFNSFSSWAASEQSNAEQVQGMTNQLYELVELGNSGSV